MLASTRESDRIRGLAARIAEIAAEPRMAAIKKRWADVNALRRPDRAPVWCRPVGCWREIIPDGALSCTEPWLRRLERQFLQILHKRDIDDDTPVDACVEVQAVFRPEPGNTWGLDVGRRESGTVGGAWGYDPPLKREEDFERLRIPTFAHDAKSTHEQMEPIAELLDGVLSVKPSAGPPLGATLGGPAADLRGLEQMMLDMASEPELMHRLMSFLRDAVLSSMDQVEATGLLTPNNTGPMACSDPIGPIARNGRSAFRNLWCFANSQEFDQVSPMMWEEFCLEYQKPIFERFGLVGYGCCENLTHKIDGVLSIPNLRIFTCSAWTDLTVVLEKAGRGCCIMWRQKASDVVFPREAGQIKQALLDGARVLQGCCYQIVLRELQTLAGHADRLHDWTRFAKEAAERYA